MSTDYMSFCVAHNAPHDLWTERTLNVEVKKIRFALSNGWPLRVISGHFRISKRCPLYPRKRTSFSTIVMSALCQKRTSAVRAEILNIRLRSALSIPACALSLSDFGQSFDIEGAHQRSP